MVWWFEPQTSPGLAGGDPFGSLAGRSSITDAIGLNQGLELPDVSRDESDERAPARGEKPTGTPGRSAPPEEASALNAPRRGWPRTLPARTDYTTGLYQWQPRHPHRR
jgi:hypothetical protein